MYRVVAPVALALVLSTACAMNTTGAVEVGDVAPPIEGKTWVSKDGKAPDVKGKVYVVEFWFAA